MTHSDIGRVNTILVSRDGSAIIATLIALPCTGHGNGLKFSGTVKIATDLKKHLNDIVLPLVNEILLSLDIKCRGFEISVISPGAASSSDLITSVSGFSIDTAVFLGMLSVGLDIPVDRRLVSTGHISTKVGDISPVSSMAAKCDAVLNNETIEQFLFPDLDIDSSFRELKPVEYETSIAATRSLNGRVKTQRVKNALDLVKGALNPGSIAISSLSHDYFKVENAGETGVAQYLVENNSDRLWVALKDSIVQGQVEHFKHFIKVFADYHIRKKTYPTSFGRNLFLLFLSVPKHLVDEKTTFPLLSMEMYIKLIQFAVDTDHDDIKKLHGVLFKDVEQTSYSTNAKQDRPTSKDHVLRLKRILNEIDQDYMDTQLTKQIDIGRSTFVMDKVSVDSYDEFNELLVTFFTHMIIHTKRITGQIKKEDMIADALDLAGKAFPGDAKYKAMLASARTGTDGGLRRIFDDITEYLKKEAREKHILSTLKGQIDPLSETEKKAILDQLFSEYPEVFKGIMDDENPERYLSNYEEILLTFVRSKSALNSLFKRL